MRLLIILLLLIIHGKAYCDSWADPVVKNYVSNNGKYILKVIPKTIPAKYWEYIEHMMKPTGKKKSIKKFTTADTTIIPCKAVLSKVENGDTLRIWERTLINEVCPVSAIVSDDGLYVVTFDEWHRVGHGDNVVVIYNQIGDLIKRFRIDDISPIPINNYSMSVSSLWWRCGAIFKQDEHAIDICFKEYSGKKISRTLLLPTFTFED